MATSRQFLTVTVLLAVCSVMTTLATHAKAQIINQPSRESEEVSRATGDFDEGELSEGVNQVGWPSIPLPKITLPKLTMPKVTMPKMPPLWPSEANGDSPALLAPFAAGFSKVSSGSKKAWEGTKDMFAIFQGKGSASSAPKPPTQPKPSLWKRLTTRSAEPEVPQTVGEFMKQPRLDP